MVDVILDYNVNSEAFPYFGKGAGLVKRWETPIPVKTKGDQRVEQALQTIEKRLNRSLFDYQSLADRDDEEIEYGIIFDFGQAVGNGRVDPRSITGNVAAGPGQTDWPQNFLNEDGRIECRLYVNLDNVFRKKATVDIAIHEMGHAMGLSETHFEGFGDEDGPVGPHFWIVLEKLYSLPIGKYAAV